MRELVAKVKELSSEEKVLKASYSDRRREILSSKRLLLFKWLLERSGFTDVDLFHDLCSGFNLTGALPELAADFLQALQTCTSAYRCLQRRCAEGPRGPAFRGAQLG